MTDSEHRFEHQFEEALDAYGRGDYQAALEGFRQVVQVQPYASEAHLNLGNAHFKLGDYQNAETSFQRALEMDPMEANAYLSLGNLAFKQSRFEEAAGYWEAFKKLNRKHANVWLNLGIVYDKLNDPGQAIENYSVFLGLEPRSEEAGRLQVRFENARKGFESHVKAAETYLKRGEEKEARELLRKALAMYPGNARLYKTYASLLYKNAEYAEALFYYQRAYALKQDDPPVLINLGVLHEKLNQPAQALWAYHQAKSIPGPEQQKVSQRFEQLRNTHQGKLPEAFSQAQTLFRQGKFRQAENLLGQLQMMSDYLSPELRREVDEWLGKTQDAMDPSLKAVKTYLARGMDAESQGQFDQAINFYQKYLSLKPDGPQSNEVQQRLAHIKTVMAAVVNTLLDQS